MNIALLMTATIDPTSTPRIVRNDPGIRLEEYKSSFAFYLRISGYDSVVVAENSGYPVDHLKQIVPHEAVIVSVQSPIGERLAKGGQALGEMTLILAALEGAEVLRAADVIVKVSGRLPIRNIETILKGIRSEPADVWCGLRRNLTIANSVCFAGTPTFFSDYLAPRADEIDETEDRNFEVILARAALSAAAAGLRWRPLPVRHRIKGIRAADGKPYNYRWPSEPIRDFKHGLYRRLLRK